MNIVMKSTVRTPILSALVLQAILIVSSSLSRADDALPPLPHYLPNSCIVDAQDPYEPNVRMEVGPLHEMCVNPLQRRSVQILAESEGRKYFQPAPGTLTIANFSHLGKFWIAQIPVDRVKNITFQTEFFPMAHIPVVGEVDIAHVQFRFAFEEGARILLKPQQRNTTQSTQAVSLKEMLFSVENIGPYGDKFDSVKGLHDNYHIAYRAISLNDKYQWMVAEQGHVVTQTRLNLSPEKTQALLTEALREGTLYSTHRPYNTINPNCSTELFVLLDRVMDLHGYAHPFLPNLGVQHLRGRNLIERSVTLPTFGEEFPRGRGLDR